MNDLPKEVTNDWDKNPFISIKILLQEPHSISVGALATAIEDNGICKYDDYGRLKTYVKDTEEWLYALGLLKTFRNYDINHYDYYTNPFPLDDLINHSYGGKDNEYEDYPSEYCFYGWMKADLPNFTYIASKQIEVPVEEKPLQERERNSYLRIIAVLLKFINGGMTGVNKHPNYASDAQLILDIEAEFSKENTGLSKRNLEAKFAEAKPTLKK